jgi:heme/copper-type cytochrome/quinol oxidase subunit 4
MLGETVLNGAGRVQIPVNDLMYMWMEKSMHSSEPFLIDMEKCFKMILCSLVIKGRLWVRFTVDGGGRSQ